MQELLADLPTALRTHASSLINAGAEDTRQTLANFTGTPDEMRILRAAIATEKSKEARSSRLKPMEAKLRKLSEIAREQLIASKSNPGGPTESPLLKKANALRSVNPTEFLKIAQGKGPIPLSTVEIVTDAQVDAAELQGLADAITRSREIIGKHEQSCHETTLEHYLEAGQKLARAQEIFTLTHSAAGALKGQSKKSLSTVDKLPETTPQDSPEVLANRGFSAWLAASLPDLKRPTAIRYATAYRSLELPLDAKPTEIRAKIKTLRHEATKANLPMPTLASVLKAAPKPQPPTESLVVLVPKSSKQLKLEDAREIFDGWMQTFDKALKRGQLDHLDRKGLLHLNDFVATVRDRINARLK